MKPYVTNKTLWPISKSLLSAITIGIIGVILRQQIILQSTLKMPNYIKTIVLYLKCLRKLAFREQYQAIIETMINYTTWAFR